MAAASTMRGRWWGTSDIALPGVYHAFLYSKGQMQDLGTLGTYSRGSAINNTGQVTGTTDSSTDLFRAFLYNEGQMQNLGTLEGHVVGGHSLGYGIKNLGQITGNSNGHAYLYGKGRCTT